MSRCSHSEPMDSSSLQHDAVCFNGRCAVTGRLTATYGQPGQSISSARSTRLLSLLHVGRDAGPKERLEFVCPAGEVLSRHLLLLSDNTSSGRKPVEQNSLGGGIAAQVADNPIATPRCETV